MDLKKHREFFDPVLIQYPIHIIGCGAIGSHIAESLVRLGISAITLYDFDIVSQHNLTNQLYTHDDINTLKTSALARHLTTINPDLKITAFNGWKPNTPLTGYIFLCVDNIEIRQMIVKENQYNRFIKAVFDFRMRLSDATHYAADWTNPKQVKDLLTSMDFTHEEAKAATPVSACGTELSVLQTVRIITSFGIANFMKFVKHSKLKKLILLDTFEFFIETYD